jgi:hypothetical protein
MPPTPTVNERRFGFHRQKCRQLTVRHWYAVQEMCGNHSDVSINRLTKVGHYRQDVEKYVKGVEEF